MTLEAVIQDQAKIPEALVDHYVETDGVFVLDVTGMKTQKDFDDYASALKKRLADAGADFAKKQGAGLSRDDVLEVVEGALKKFVGGGKPKGKGADGEGAGGPGAGGDIGKGNPFSKAGWNMTAQGKLYTANKVEAERLMKSAGVTLGAVAPVR